MIKHANKKFEKIYNDVNAIYSYILTSSEIEKLSNNIIKVLKVNYGEIDFMSKKVLSKLEGVLEND